MQKYFSKALPKSINEKDYTIDCIMSTEVTDRHGEIVDIETMQVDEFLTNPVVAQFHDYDEMSVGRVTSITKTMNDAGQKQLECTIKFAVEEYDVAATLWNLYKGGYMSAFSIGFMVGDVNTDVATQETRLLNCNLLEISCVLIPANQLALAKSKGINVSPVVKNIPEDVLSKSISDEITLIKSLLLDPKLAEAKSGVTLIVEAKHERANALLNKAIRLLR